MTHALAGVIGHVDHGKTALVKALTGTDTDRLAEEKRRGISIVLGFAHLALPEGGIDLVDMPGHERFVRAMVAGATGIDAALLVVAANEGVKPQTVEHVAIAGLIGVRRAVVAVTKCDLVAAAAAKTAGATARRLLAAAGLGDAPVVCTSATSGLGLDALRRALAAWPSDPAARVDHGFFYLPLDRAFAVPGFGTVATGTLRRGAITVGDTVEIMPCGQRAVVRGLQVHGAPVESALPGRRLAVNLRGIDHGEIARGAALATPGMLAPSRWLDVELSLLPSAPRPLAGGATLRLLFGTSDVAARLRLLDGGSVDPGARALAQLRCEAEIAIPSREPFILRAPAPLGTIGGGRVLDPLAVRRRRFDKDILGRLRGVATAAPAVLVAAELAAASHRGRRLDDLARLAGHAPERVRDWAARSGAVFLGDGTVLDGAQWRALRQRILLLLDGFHRRQPGEPGLPRERLRQLLPEDLAAPIFSALLAQLANEGRLIQEQGIVRRRDFRLAQAQRDADAALARAVEDAFRQGGLAPPDPATVIGTDPRRRQALRRLLRDGALVLATDRVQKRDIVFHRDAVAEARRRIADAFADAPGFLVREAGARLGISRKYSVPLLEHLDAAGFTRRIGDRRVLARPREPAASRGAAALIRD